MKKRKAERKEEVLQMEVASGVKMKTKSNSKRIFLLAEAMKDEKGAPKMYSRLLRTLPRNKQGTVRGIIRDERRHLRLLKRIKGGI